MRSFQFVFLLRKAFMLMHSIDYESIGLLGIQKYWVNSYFLFKNKLNSLKTCNLWVILLLQTSTVIRNLNLS